MQQLTWKVWGNQQNPLFEGDEEAAKTFAINFEGDGIDSPDTIYLEDPDGREFAYDSAFSEWRRE